jgi:molecular chaperone DnaK
MLSERFPGKPLKGTESGINPDEIVAIGAGRIASELDPDNYEVVSSGLVDVTGHTLSVEALGQDNKPELVPIIVKETAIPVEASHTFRSLGNGQSQVKIKVWQGEGKFPTDNEELALMIGEYILEIDPIREPTPLLIALDIDKNGILVASAKNLINGNVVSCKINYNDSSQMTPEELKKKMAALDATMNSEVGSTSNPLDGNAPGTRKPVPPSGKVPDFDNREQSPKAAQSGSPDYEMNPIVKSLYDKAINKFGSIPMDKQKLVMQIIGEMQRAAQAGDQAKLFELYGPLNQLVGNL